MLAANVLVCRIFYELGPQARILGTLRLDRRSLGELALPVLEELREASKETVFLSVRDGFELTYVECLRAPHPVQMYGEVGQRVPLHATSAAAEYPPHPSDGAVRAVVLRGRPRQPAPGWYCTAAPRARR